MESILERISLFFSMAASSFSRFRGKVCFVCRDFCTVETQLKDGSEERQIQVYFSCEDFRSDWAVMHFDLTVYFKIGELTSFSAATDSTGISDLSKISKVLPFASPMSLCSEDRFQGIIEMLDPKMRCGLIWTAPKPTKIASVTPSLNFVFNFVEFKQCFEVGSKVTFTGRQLPNFQCVAVNVELYPSPAINTIDNSILTSINSVEVQPRQDGWLCGGPECFSLPGSISNSTTVCLPEFSAVDKVTSIGLITTVYSTWGLVWSNEHGIMRFNKPLLLDCTDLDFLRFHPIQAVEFEAQSNTVPDGKETGFQICKLWPLSSRYQNSSTNSSCNTSMMQTVFDPELKLELTKARVTRFRKDTDKDQLFAYSLALHDYVFVNWSAFSLQTQPHTLHGRVCEEDILSLLVIRNPEPRFAPYEALAVIRNEVSDIDSLWNLCAFSSRLAYDAKVMWKARQLNVSTKQMTTRRCFDEPFSTNGNRALVQANDDDWPVLAATELKSEDSSQVTSAPAVVGKNETDNVYECGSTSCVSAPGTGVNVICGFSGSVTPRGRGRGKPVVAQNTSGNDWTSGGGPNVVRGVGLVTTVYKCWGLMWCDEYDVVRFSVNELGSVSQFHPVQLVEFEAVETESVAEYRDFSEKTITILKMRSLSTLFSSEHSFSNDKLSLVSAKVADKKTAKNRTAKYRKEYAIAKTASTDSYIYLHWTAFSFPQAPLYGRVPEVGTCLKLLVVPSKQRYRELVQSTHYALLPVRSDINDVTDLLDRCAYSSQQDFMSRVQWTPTYFEDNKQQSFT